LGEKKSCFKVLRNFASAHEQFLVTRGKRELIQLGGGFHCLLAHENCERAFFLKAMADTSNKESIFIPKPRKSEVPHFQGLPALGYRSVSRLLSLA